MTPVRNAKIFVHCLLFLFLLTFSACGKTIPGNAENGQKWYNMNNCSSCHGATGSGGRGPNIAAIDMGFGSFVKKLRKKDAPIMPPFPETKISEQDAADIYAFLKKGN